MLCVLHNNTTCVGDHSLHHIVVVQQNKNSPVVLDKLWMHCMLQNVGLNKGTCHLFIMCVNNFFFYSSLFTFETIYLVCVFCMCASAKICVT